MRECRRHPSESHSGGGVCASCLRERLTWLWRGERFHLHDPEILGVGSVRKAIEADGASLPQILSVGVRYGDRSIVVPASGATSGNPTAVVPRQSSQSLNSDIVVEWAEFQARRRIKASELELGSPIQAKSRSFDSSDAMPPVEVLLDNRSSQVRILMSAQKLRTRSMPLDNRGAEDTASRVIREQADVLYVDDLDYLEVGLQDRDDGGAVVALPNGGRCVSPAWRPRKSTPKWVRVLISPMTARNKVFPSRSKDDVRKGRGGNSRKRLTRLASADWSDAHARGESSPPRRRSMFSWLQDSERTKLKKNDQMGQVMPSFSSAVVDSGSMDSLLKDLITVGHLHEIAEEIEEEDEVVTDSFNDIASFGKFLLLAAQRKPQAGLTRLSSAVSV